MVRRRSNFTMIEAALKSATIVVPPEVVAPQARYEQAMVAAIDGMLAESRRVGLQGRPPRRTERGGTLH